MNEPEREGPCEIAMIGDLTESEAGLCEKLLEVEPGGECLLYIDSPGGSPYSGLAITSLILLRGLSVRGIVAGECSSAALWPFAACQRRLVTPLSVLLFHRPRWQSDENVGPTEASQWARHFGRLETDMDQLLADLLHVPVKQVQDWSRSGRYVSGPELAEAGGAEVVELKLMDVLGKKCRGRP